MNGRMGRLVYTYLSPLGLGRWPYFLFSRERTIANRENAPVTRLTTVISEYSKSCRAVTVAMSSN